MRDDAVILVAHDFSAQSLHAVERAASLAAARGLALVAVHVVEDVPAVGDWVAHSDDHLLETLAARLGEAAHARLRDAIEPLAGAAGASVTTLVETGNVADQLVRLADAGHARLIVVGAHGRHALRDVLLGTTVERLLQRASHPVLVVRGTGAAQRRLLVATDFSADAVAATRAATRTFPESPLRVIHAVNDTALERMREGAVSEQAIERLHRGMRESAAQQLAVFLEHCGLDGARVDTRIRDGYPPHVIRDEARADDLLVMGTHGRSRLARWLLGSVASRLVHELTCDMLLARDSRER